MYLDRVVNGSEKKINGLIVEKTLLGMSKQSEI